MANYASTEVRISGSEVETQEFFNLMSGLERKEKPSTANDWGRYWLGEIVTALGGDWQQVRCRGEWSNLDFNDGVISFSCESAWVAPTEVFDLIKEKYPTLEVIYISEESGCEYYESNDVEGRFFTDRYIVDICTEDEEYQTEYFEELEDALNWIEKMTGKKVATENEVELLNEQFQEDNENAYCYLHEFEII